MINKIRLIFTIFLFTAISVFAQKREVAVTVYNDNLAVIKDVRQLELKAGASELRFRDVAARIDPTSVHFKSLTAPDKVIIAEQNYEYDLVNSNKILQKYLDKSISLTTEQDSLFSGKLLSDDGSFVTLQRASGGIKLISKSRIVSINFPELPEGLITHPTLVWQIINQNAGVHQTEVSYQTEGMNWHAEYVAIAKNDDSSLEINSWVSIDNRSGADYPDAKLKLIAGDVHRVRQPIIRKQRFDESVQMLAARPEFEEKSFFEYHMYTLNQRSTIKNNQIKQLSLFPATETSVKKIYTFEASKSATEVRVNLEFKNSKNAGLGMALPAGKVRVYKEDPADHSLEFVGEDNLKHTPKDEKVRLYLGNAFDIVAEKNLVEKKPTGKHEHEESWQVNIRNHKEELIEVIVIENIYGFWKLKQSSHPYEKESAEKINFAVKIPANSEATLSYTIEITKK